MLLKCESLHKKSKPEFNLRSVTDMTLLKEYFRSVWEMVNVPWNGFSIV